MLVSFSWCWSLNWSMNQFQLIDLTIFLHLDPVSWSWDWGCTGHQKPSEFWFFWFLAWCTNLIWICFCHCLITKERIIMRNILPGFCKFLLLLDLNFVENSYIKLQPTDFQWCIISIILSWWAIYNIDNYGATNKIIHSEHLSAIVYWSHDMPLPLYK